MKFSISFLLLLTSIVTFAQQKEIIKGNIIEEGTGRTLPGANITIKSIKKSTVSDADGNFIIRDIEVGKYDIEFAALGFDKKVLEVDVVAGEVAALNISLSERKNTLEEVTVTKTKAKVESVKSLLVAQKNSVRVSDGISGESIKRTPDKTTSDVLKRISGASIQDNKFVIIRGLNDRYNASYLNGSPLPSSEPDKKAFSFDIFPANMIDNLVIYKTASPDLPGEFAGGVIEISTKAVADKNFQSLSIGGGYNTLTTGKKQVYAEGGKKDWIGVDDGTRAFPNSFPTTEEFKTWQNSINPNEGYTNNILEATKSYKTNWSLKEKTFSPNASFSYTMGRHAKLAGQSSFSFVGSLSYSSSNSFNEIQRKRYEQPSLILSDQIELTYGNQTLLGGILNFSAKIDANNTISFKNLYSLNSENKIFTRSGSENQLSEQVFSNTSARLFTSNKIYTGQLTGEHFITTGKIKIGWVGSYSVVERIKPNDRRNTYNYTKYEDGTMDQPQANIQSGTVNNESAGSLYSSDNNEDIFSSKIDISKKIKLSEKIGLDIKTGFFTQSRDRVFTNRQMGYTKFVGTVNGVNYNASNFDSNLLLQGDESIFNPSNFGVISTKPKKTGFMLYDATSLKDSYKASSKLNAGYLMLDNSFGAFRLIYGLRLESYNQKLFTRYDDGKIIDLNNKIVDYLPSANLIVGLNKKQNIRLSFSKTVNRPEFRELAPFLFYDPATRFNTEGNPELKIATIQNYDLRYEVFPGRGQLFSISAFYKKFKDPIELQSLGNNTNKYQNGDNAEVKGIELEFRTLLSSIFGTQQTKVLDDITLYSNVAIMKSKVDISNIVNGDATIILPMQGQSPYVLNGGIQYINTELGWGSALNVNRIGNRIFIQGDATDDAFQTAIWEKARTVLDFQVSKSFMKNKLELKLNIQNILAQDQMFYRNTILPSDEVKGAKGFVNNIFTGSKQNVNGYNPATDDVIWNFKTPRTFSFTATYNF